MARKTLLFVSPRFLFPATTGGQIRTSQILRGLLGQRFDITLVSPATSQLVIRHGEELQSVCDNFCYWPHSSRGALFPLTRLRFLLDELPIPIATDRSKHGSAVVLRQLQKGPDFAVFDFPHAAVLAPPEIGVPSALFTHNVEAEIFKRHMEVSRSSVKRLLWRNQYKKMLEFEQRTLARFDTVIAVSERDAQHFTDTFGMRSVEVIPTGVDLEAFPYSAPGHNANVVFIGSMDWLANVDGIEYFMNEVWPSIIAAVPHAAMTVVGRNPPAQLVQKARSLGYDWTFTGFVDDIRQWVNGARVSVIPLRVGGGTRMKAYESMALGIPVVSTAIGVEGLPLTDGEHFFMADRAPCFADKVVGLLRDYSAAERLARDARRYVEANFSFREAARDFERICLATLARRSA